MDIDITFDREQAFSLLNKLLEGIRNEEIFIRVQLKNDRDFTRNEGDERCDFEWHRTPFDKEEDRDECSMCELPESKHELVLVCAQDELDESH